MNKKEILVCDCHSSEHQLIVYYSDDEIAGEKVPMCYVHVHLNKRPFLRRLIYAFKYVIGRQSRFGAFDEFIFNHEDAEKIQEIANYLRNESTNK
jgi:hypothetical protein